MLLGGCVAMPSAREIRSDPAYLPASACDGRARFRQLFCTLAEQKQPAAQCADYLWQLADEAPPRAAANSGAELSRLRVFIVGGAFSDCFGEASIAYRSGIADLQQRGIAVHTLPVSGRSSSAVNAAMIARALLGYQLEAADQVILLGYSKGTVDILQYLEDYAERSALVDAVVSVAGPVWGSQVAESGAWAYDTLLSHAFAGRCNPGDGGVVDSLLPERRLQHMAGHPPPSHIRYYSLLAIATSEHLSRGLRPSWQMLAREDRRNDGQVLPREGILPGSTLLGYANADHWSIAVDIEKELPFVAARPDQQPFPRDALLEAIIHYVAEDLAATEAPASTCGSGAQP